MIMRKVAAAAMPGLTYSRTPRKILFIHEGSMIVRSGGKEFECRAGDIVWLPEGCTLDYDMMGRRRAYFDVLYPFDWAVRHGMEEP